MPAHDHTDMLTFGYIPQLPVLSLSNIASIYHKNLKLSEFLHNVDVVNLNLTLLQKSINLNFNRLG